MTEIVECPKCGIHITDFQYNRYHRQEHDRPTSGEPRRYANVQPDETAGGGEPAGYDPQQDQWLPASGEPPVLLRASDYETPLGAGAVRIHRGHPGHCPIEEPHEGHTFIYDYLDRTDEPVHGLYYCNGRGFRFADPKPADDRPPASGEPCVCGHRTETCTREPGWFEAHATPPALDAERLARQVLDLGGRLEGFDHWRTAASSKASDPDDIRWECVCGYAGSPDTVRRHWEAHRHER